MNNSRLLLLGVVILAVGAAGGYGISKWSARHETPGTGAPPERAVLYWHDPMKPEVHFDKPGKSPFMDMQLVPVYADEAPSEGAVKISPAIAQSLGIRIGKVEKVTVASTLGAIGAVGFDEQLVNVVQARVEGYVGRLHVRAPLQRVRRGQPLADIVAPEWLAAQEQYLALLDASSERGREIRDAARERLRVLGIPDASIRSLENSRKASGSTTIYSPADGVVTELGVRDGAAFSPGATLFRIKGLATVWVTAQVPESQVSLVPPQGTVTARATAWPGMEFAGRVVALLPDVDVQTRTLPVRVSIDNRDGKLAPGMFVSLDLVPAAALPQLVVPSEAVIVTGERTVVIVARDDGAFDVANVKTGADREGRTVILEGLTEGQSVVLSGQFLIDSEASLRSAVSRLGAPSAAGESP
jgi:membrane fusion protein, copper/silver efflux system